jgi:hypothetical protein
MAGKDPAQVIRASAAFRLACACGRVSRTWGPLVGKLSPDVGRTVQGPLPEAASLHLGGPTVPSSRHSLTSAQLNLRARAVANARWTGETNDRTARSAPSLASQRACAR